MKPLMQLLVFTLALTVFGAEEDDFLRPVGKPPPATPQRRQGGEALPPLPGPPVTPLRRSEKKRPPAPAKLIGKVMWGSHRDWKWPDGRTTRVYDWNMVPADCAQLLKATRKQLGLEFTTETLALGNFSATPAEIPVLHFSGGRRLRFTAAQRESLRRYMLAGGMVWFDSVVGSPYFYTSALSELARMFPETSVKRVPLDHPVFHMIDDTVRVATKRRPEVVPVLDGLYVGCRLAAVVSPYGLGCGWDKTNPDLIPEARYYGFRSSLRLGMNLVAYAIGYFRVGQAHAKAELYRNEDLTPNRDPVVLAQLRTNGTWNTEPGATGKLWRFMNRNAGVKTNYRQRIVTLPKDDINALPFIYLSGITDFNLDAGQLAALRRYLLSGGYLLINSSLGLAEFDRAVRRELPRLFPQARLRRIPLDHSVFLEGPFRVPAATYTLAARAREKDLKTPYLEGIEIDGEYHVVYSKYDLAAGWQGEDHPLSYAYMPAESLRLGANIFTYFLTH